MPVHMYNLTVDALKRIGKTPAGSKVAILGCWAFISNSDDARNPRSETFRDLLVDEGCRVGVHDSYVLEYPGVDISHELSDVVKGADMVAILTGHDEYFSLDAGGVEGVDGAGASCGRGWTDEHQMKCS